MTISAVCLSLSFSNRTFGDVYEYNYISLGGSTEPPLDPRSQISLCHIQYIVGGHCNFTHNCVPPFHQFIHNFA